MSQIKDNIQLVLLDIVILAVVPFLSLFIRFEGDLKEPYFTLIKFWDAYIVLVSIVVFFVYKMYRRIWQYARLHDLIAIVGAVTLSTGIVFLSFIFFNISIPKSIYILNWMLGIGFIGTSRLVFKVNSISLLNESGNLKKVLIVGAGAAGAMIAREIEQRNHTEKVNLKIEGFIDDDPSKVGSQLAGIHILGNMDSVGKFAEKKEVDEIIIAIPSAKGEIVRRIASLCRKTGCKVQVVPGLYELIGRPSVKQLRDIRLEDLLRRDAIHLDLDEIAGYIQDKVVLVTGAGGSIGGEICRQVSKVGAKQILLLGRGENSIYEIHQELKVQFPTQQYKTIIADVRDYSRMQEIFARYTPDVVFHAAAHKHVPLMELQPIEAIKNNVFGTKNVAELANEFKSDIFVLISTDKAVNPTSVMGATKRTAELVLEAINGHSRTKFVTVRFGNVLGSRGSVVPLFERQILAGGPVTITHPEMTRYFMTIPEAVQLVLQAGGQAQGGEVFLFDMGDPVKIKDMAYDLIELHGLVPEEDIQLVYTGLRPGEKLYEELLTAEEGTTSTKHKKIFKAKIQALDAEQLKIGLQVLTKTRENRVVLQTLKDMIPTYHSKQLENILKENQ